jgi:hypothetical protein
MFDNSRVQLVRQALRDGIPLHRVEAYFDWIDETAREPRSQDVIPAQHKPGIARLAQRELNPISGKLA